MSSRLGLRKYQINRETVLKKKTWSIIKKIFLIGKEESSKVFYAFLGGILQLLVLLQCKFNPSKLKNYTVYLIIKYSFSS